MAQARRPRFRRSKEVAPIHITDRDFEILRQIYRHRFLRTSQIVALVGGSRQQILRRLQKLFHHGYVERPPCQIDYYYEGGSREIAYGLANRGAAYLKHARKLSIQTFDWNEKNRSVRRLFLEHALLASSVTAGVEIACRAHSNLRFYLESEIPLPDRWRGKRDFFKWTVTLRNGLRAGVIPDRVFAIENEFQGSKEKVLFCLEADRGTMPINRSDNNASSFSKKLACYTASMNANLPSSLFGTKRMRVLTVTNTPERLSRLRDAARGKGIRQGLFLFSCAENFKPDLDLVSNLIWTTSNDGLTVALFSESENGRANIN